ITKGTQVGSVLSPGMKGNRATLKPRLRFTVFGVPSKLTDFTLLASKIFGWKSMRATSRECSTILIFNWVLWLTGGSSESSSSNSSWSMYQAQTIFLILLLLLLFSGLQTTQHGLFMPIRV